jgi:signal transduction histidine kinase
MTRRVVWLQVLIGWLPIWALFTALIVVAHGGGFLPAAHIATRMILAGAALGVLVHRLTERLHWPRPFRVSFLAIHIVAAVAFSVTWVFLNSVIETIVRGVPVIVIGYGIVPFLVLGVWLYVMVAGVSYSAKSAERVARAEANAIKAQLAALRAQLHPHFLFNALHTVVQLIPREPQRASQAAEELAGLLRGTIDADRDLVPLSDELAFVEKYLSIERIRFEDRLHVRVDAAPEARAAHVPSFAVQSLVENAVRHGAAPREEPTDIVINARVNGSSLMISVTDNGAGATTAGSTSGTGLKRLRERLTALYGGGASLFAGHAAGGGYSATLTIPLEVPD